MGHASPIGFPQLLQLCKAWTPLLGKTLQGRLSAVHNVLEAPSLAGLNPLNPGTQR